MSENSLHLDPESVDDLWRELHGRIRPRVGSADRADDVVQDTFLNALRRPPADQRGIAAWLHVVARHLAIRDERRERNRSARERAVAAVPSVEADAPDSRQESREALRVLASLDEPYREVLRLRYLEGLEVEEIAQRLGRTPGTVRSQVKRGLDRLRRRVGGHAPEERRPWAFALLGSVWRRSPLARPLAGLVAAGTCAFVVLSLRDAQPPLGARLAAASVPAGAADAALPRTDAPEAGSPRASLASDERAPAPEPSGPRDEWEQELEGVVLDASGAPAAGAEVRAGPKAENGRVVAVAGPDGRFRLRAIDLREWVWAQGDALRASNRHLVASARHLSALELRLGPAPDAARARVRDWDGAPAAGALVTLFAGAGDGERAEVGAQGTLEAPRAPVTVAAGPDGALALPCAPGEPYRVLVVAEGRSSFLRAGRAPLDPAATIELELPRAASVAGTLLANDGSPGRGARLALVQPGRLPDLETVTDERGGFRFRGVTPGAHEIVLLQADWPDASLRVQNVATCGEESWLELSSSLASSVRGRLLDDEVASGWTVEIERADSGDYPDLRRTTTDELGRFSFASCSPEAEHNLRLYRPGSEAPTQLRRGVRAGPDPITVRTHRERWAPGRLRGLLEPADPAHSACFVEVYNAAIGVRVLAHVDPRSRQFVARDLPPASYRVRAWVTGLGPLELGMAVIEPGEVLAFRHRLRLPGRLDVRVELPPDVCAERVEVVVLVRSPFEDTLLTSRRLARDPATGRYCATLPALDQEYDYEIRVDGKCVQSRKARLHPGLTESVDASVPSLVAATLELEAPRAIAELEMVVLEASGRQRAWKQRAAAQVGAARERFDVLLPVGTTELAIETTRGLRGRWSGGPVADGDVLAIALEDAGAPR